MKGLKFSFAAVVAILAIGVTVAAQAGVFAGKVRISETECFVPVSSAAPITVKTTNCLTTSNIIPTSVCNELLEGQYIFALNPNSIVQDPEADCDGTAQFCCLTIARLTPQETPCSGQPTFTFDEGTFRYKVLQILCKPAA